MSTKFKEELLKICKLEFLKEDVRNEVLRFLPHYIIIPVVFTTCITLGCITYRAVDVKIIQNNNYHQNMPQNMPQDMHQNMSQNMEQNRDSEDDGDGLLPSEYKIGLPYEESIKDTSKPLFVEFYADWCPHCRKLTPIVYDLSETMPELNFSTVDTQAKENYYLSKKYKVDKFPFLVIIDTKTGKAEEILLDETTSTAEGLKARIEKSIKTMK